MRLASIFLSCFFCLMLTLPAHAARHSKLTDTNVRNFVEQATALTAGGSDFAVDRIVQFLEKHLHKKARFKSVISYILPGFPPQDTALSFDKDDYIENIKNGVNAVEDHESIIEIQSIQITDDGRQAIVVTSGKETGVMQVPLPDNTIEAVPIEGFTNCNQIIRLSRRGVIQMYNAVCDTKIEFVNNL